MTLEESRLSLCRHLNISLTKIKANTQELFNWDDIDGFIWDAVLEAWDYAPWIFREKSYTTTTETYVSSTGAGEYYDYPDDFVSDSIFLLRVKDDGGYMKRYRKISYLDYLKVREDDELETNEEKLWADHQRFYFINPPAWDKVSGRTIEIWGLMRASSFTDSTDLLPFSPNSDNEENSGNHAIVRLAYAYALESDKLNNPNKATLERNLAYQTLELLAKKEREAQADYEIYDRPFFEHQKLI